MAASASDPTSKQYPIWITNQPGRQRLFYKIYFDEAGLNYHLIRKLSYNEDDANSVVKQITQLFNNTSRLDYFWNEATNERMSSEVINVILQSIEHSQLIYMLKYQDWDRYTALHRCAHNKRCDVIQMILNNLSEEECYRILSIRGTMWRWTPLSMSCSEGDTESVRVMLNHINQDMRYSLLHMRDEFSNTPLHYVSSDGHAVMKVIHESVTQTQWINLLQMKGDRAMTVLQYAVYWDQGVCWDEQSSIETIRESVSDKEWIKLLSTPLPKVNKRYHYKHRHQRVASKIDELRAEAKTASRVKSALLITDQSGKNQWIFSYYAMFSHFSLLCIAIQLNYAVMRQRSHYVSCVNLITWHLLQISVFSKSDYKQLVTGNTSKNVAIQEHRVVLS